MDVALLGLGHVGQGLRRLLEGHPSIRITRILEREPKHALDGRITQDFEEILSDDSVCTVVEALGGMEPAHTYVRRALARGKHVISTNGSMLAYHFHELLSLAVENGVALRIDAAVSGGVPWMLNLTRAACADRITAISGIVNSTTNLILDAMHRQGGQVLELLKEAQRIGWAEADPYQDIDGLDVRNKLALTAAVAFGGYCDPESIPTFGIRTLTPADIQVFNRRKVACRLLMRARRLDEQSIVAYVEPMLLKADQLESNVRTNNNLISFVAEHLGMQKFYGPGIGQDPVAAGILADLIDLQMNNNTHNPLIPKGRLLVNNRPVAHRYYVRTTARLGLPVEKMATRDGMHYYLTEPVSVEYMHTLALSQRLRDPDFFFAGIREEQSAGAQRT